MGLVEYAQAHVNPELSPVFLNLPREGYSSANESLQGPDEWPSLAEDGGLLMGSRVSVAPGTER